MTGVAPGLQNQCDGIAFRWVGSIPTRSRQKKDSKYYEAASLHYQLHNLLCCPSRNSGGISFYGNKNKRIKINKRVQKVSQKASSLYLDLIYQLS